MATASSSTESTPNQKSDPPKEEAKPVADLTGNPKFALPGTGVIKTAEDALQAYLRGEIEEDELRAVRAAYGLTGGDIVTRPNVEPLDAAYERKIPEDMVQGPTQYASLEDRLKVVEEDEKAREKATKEAEASAKASS